MRRSRLRKFREPEGRRGHIQCRHGKQTRCWEKDGQITFVIEDLDCARCQLALQVIVADHFQRRPPTG